MTCYVCAISSSRNLLIACSALGEMSPNVRAAYDLTRAARMERTRSSCALTFAGVSVTDRAIAGWMRPYRDPELGCLMDAWFEGQARGDTLDGMYFSHPEDAAASVRLGTWWAARRR